MDTPPTPPAVLEVARRFIQARRWQVARSMPEAPHEYTLPVWHPDQPAFDAFLQLIRDHGRREKWRGRTFTYLYVDAWRYWTHFERGTRIVNRARIELRQHVPPMEQLALIEEDL